MNYPSISLSPVIADYRDLVEDVRLENKRGILKIRGGREFHIKIHGKSDAELDELEVSDWREIATKTVEILHQKGILASLEDAANFSGARVAENGVTQGERTLAHDHAPDTTQMWRILRLFLESLGKQSSPTPASSDSEPDSESLYYSCDEDFIDDRKLTPTIHEPEEEPAEGKIAPAQGFWERVISTFWNTVPFYRNYEDFSEFFDG